MKEEQYLKRKIQQLRVKCPRKECEIKCRVDEVNAYDSSRPNNLYLYFNCIDHGIFSKHKTLKSLLK